MVAQNSIVLRDSLRFRRPHSTSLGWQLLVVLLAWSYLCGLHWGNDGLWYQGDAPRHALNGIFWKDYLGSFSLDPKGYALSYYARYPAINPTSYPPGFYLVEGAAFGIFGPSPYVAKGLVLVFALMAALYTTAWLRRWVALEAGWAGALLLLLPAVVRWSHAIMLNVPALALSIAALYYVRRWLDPTGSYPVYPGVVFCLLAIFTYFPAGVILFIAAAWLILAGRWKLLFEFRTLLAGIVSVILLLPMLLVVLRWAPTYVAWVVPAVETVGSVASWTYYAERLPDMFSLPLLMLAGAGIAAGALSRRWRRETGLLVIMAAVTYAVFSCLQAKESRYVLLLSVPLIGLATIAIFSVCQAMGSSLRWSPRASRTVALGALATVLLVQAWRASQVSVESLRGFQEVVAFLESAGPREAFFYDGSYSGVFTFYVRAGDPEFQRRVVGGHKLLYAAALGHDWRLQEFVSSPEDVVERLRSRGGCRWLAIEMSRSSEANPPMRYLREAVQGPEFELVRSFPIEGRSDVDRVDVYRLLGSVEVPDEVELSFPILGEGSSFRVRPIPPRSASE